MQGTAPILGQEDGKNRRVTAVGDLSKAIALAFPHEAALAIRDDVSFFQAVRTVLTKSASNQQRPEYALEAAMRSSLGRLFCLAAHRGDGVVDVLDQDLIVLLDRREGTLGDLKDALVSQVGIGSE